MDNPGVSTFSASITAASGAPGISTTPVFGLDGMLSATIDMNFSYGSGGTTVDAYAQFSLDSGTTWQDAAHYQFSTASAREQFNISSLTPKVAAVAPTDGTLSGNTAVDGFIGPSWRLKYISVGTYANTTLIMRLVAR